MYGMTVWGRIWGIPGSMDVDQNTRQSPTKEDVCKLQVLQNKCMRIMTDSDYQTPIRTLLSKTSLLSVHQQMATSAYANIQKTKLPSYHYTRLFMHEETGIRPNRIEYQSSLTRFHFFYQSSRLWDALPDSIASSDTKQNFKKMCKRWIKANIMEKP